MVEKINVRQQELYDEIVETGFKSTASEGLFERVRDRVVILAGANVAYNPEEDAWHPQSAAVWHAAWTDGLMALCIA